MMASKNTDAEFAYGSGHLNPAKAADPGLVYDACEADYVNMLCSQGYSTKNLRIITGDNSTSCSRNRGSVWDLNYPSFALSFRSGHRFSARYPRTVTNVGLAKSVYRVKVTSPSKLKITVKPNVLTFTHKQEKQRFVVKLSGVLTDEEMFSASIVWTDGIHQVRSPIVVYSS